ncbi:MAG: hypothetical protein A2293_03630 [Elusimicrobia bacterium RIFOXYB2_FULL_49_7]|nr:MAG: hypothetical protein A2293_03630 [Elusimicrobia bacterium RIFOXYB2_FULL_49_7]
MIFLSLGRLLLFTLFFFTLRAEFRHSLSGRLTQRLYVLSFVILAIGELVIFAFALGHGGQPWYEQPLRPLFEICAFLLLSFLCNYEHNRLNEGHLKTVIIYYGLALLAPIVIILLFSADVNRVMLLGIEIVLVVKFLLNAADKLDDTFERHEIVLIGTGLIFFLADLFLRFIDRFSGIGLTLAVPACCMAFLSYAIRGNRRILDKEIEMRDKEIQIFADITKKLNSTFELSPLLNGFVVEICGILDAYAAALYLDKPSIQGGKTEGTASDTQELVCEAVYGFYPPPQPVDERVVTKIEFLHKAVKTIPVKKGLRTVGRVFNSGKGELAKDVDKNDSFIQTIPKITMTKTMITLPLMREGKVYGVFQLINHNDGENFSEEDFRFAEMIIDQASLAIYNAFLIEEREKKLETDADLKAAREIQLSLIPKTIPDTPYLDIAKHFSPTRQIGGDYYDFIPIDESHLGVIIADVSGKGVTGGLVMSVMRTLMRMISATSLSPKSVLMELNKGVEIAVKEKHMFITVLYCVFDMKQKKVTLCRAGHNPFLVCKGATRQLEQYKPEGIALGIIDSDTFGRITREIEISYDSGDSFFFYTDGVVEEFNSEKQMFGDEKLKDYLEKTVPLPSAAIIDGLIVELSEFRGQGQEQHDDIAMINIKAR